MDCMQGYQRLAFQCMKLAQAVNDPSTQDQLVQLAQAYTSLAEHAQEKVRQSRVDGSRSDARDYPRLTRPQGGR
jgi:hypothetical protein